MSAVIHADNFFYGLFHTPNHIDFAEKFETSLTSDLKSLVNNLRKKLVANEVSLRNVHVASDNQIFSFVPTDFYNESKKNSFLKNQVNDNIINSKLIKAQYLDEQNAYCVYQEMPDLEPFRMLTKNINYSHFMASITKYVLNHIHRETFVAAYIGPNRAYIIVKKNNQWLMSNSYTCHDKEAFLYFIALSYYTHKLDREIDKLYLLGSIEEDSELYQLLYRYIKEIEIPGFDLSKSGQLSKYNTHLFYGLQAIQQCGL